MARDDRVLKPFWLHQAAEYLIGLVLVAQGLQSPTPVVPALAGGLIVVNTACVDGPIGAFRLTTRRAHRWADLVVIGILVVAAALPWLDVDNTSRLLMVIVAVILGVVWWNSSFEPSVTRKRDGAVDRTDAVGRFAGRAVGNTVRAARRWHR